MTVEYREVADTEKKTSLTFTGFSTAEGFASKTLATENSVAPGPIIRELIQNSLDAGQLAGRDQVRVCFVFEELVTKDLPGIKEYREAFDAALETHKGHLENAQAQISRIKKSLQAPTVKVLNVIDNGIGLNTERMNSLLGDGTTSKSEQESAGSYGLGHFTAFPASNLQFILYGGVTSDSKRTASAHSILASHEINGELRGKDGFLIKDAQPTVRNRYIFPGNGEIPPFLDSQLDIIEKDSDSGSVVAITAFNDFLEDDEDSCVETILSTAANHFFPSVRSGRLVVSVIRNSGTKVLDKTSLGDVISKNIKDTRRGDPLSNSKAYSAYQTLVISDGRTVETTYGDVTIHIRQSTQERTRINLFRSGMWITDNLPRNRQGNYAGYKPFNALVLVDPPSEAFKLVRKSEGEKHLDISVNRLADEDRGNFNSLFEEIRSRIIEGLEKSETQVYSPDDFMLINPVGDGLKSSRRKKSYQSDQDRSSIPLVEEVEESTSSLAPSESSIDYQPGEENETDSESFQAPVDEPGRTPSFNRSGRDADVLTVARVTGGRVTLAIRSNEDLANAGVRLTLDNGADASCQKPIQERFIQFKREALVDGHPLGKDAYRGEGGKDFELLIGSMTKDQSKTVTVPLLGALSRDSVIKVNVVSRSK